MHRIIGAGTGAVARRPARRHVEPERRFLRGADAVVVHAAPITCAGRAPLGDQEFRVPNQVGMALGEPPRAHARPDFLVRRREEDDVALERHPRALEDHQRHELRDPLPLHVERSAAPDVTALDGAAERIHLPVLRRRKDDVHMVEENQRPRAAVAPQARVQVRLAGRRLEGLGLDAVASQHRGQPARCHDLVTGRVRRIDAQVPRQQRRRLVA